MGLCMCVCVCFFCFCFFFWGGGGGGGERVDDCNKSHGRNGPPNRTASYVGYVNSSGVHGGLSFTVKYCYYFTKTKELNV